MPHSNYIQPIPSPLRTEFSGQMASAYNILSFISGKPSRSGGKKPSRQSPGASPLKKEDNSRKFLPSEGEGDSPSFSELPGGPVWVVTGLQRI